MKRNNWPVEEEGIRPAGKPHRCFYCDAVKGGAHATACVIRNRTAVVKLTLELVVAMPEAYTAHDIEFHFNESSSCQDNIVALLQQLVERLDVVERCTCGLITAEYVREATAADEERQQLFVEHLPS